MSEQQEKQAGMWAIVELFGHQRIAGFMTEQTVAGSGFVRIDVPEINAEPARDVFHEGPVAAHTKMFGPGAIYAINPVDETIARAAASQIRHKPVESYGLADALRNMNGDERRRLLTSQALADE